MRGEGGGPQPWQVVLLVVGTVLAGLWIVAATAGATGVGWLVQEIALELGVALPGWAAPVIVLSNAAAVAVPAGVLWLLARTHLPALAGVWAAGRAWTIMAGAAAVLGLARAVPIVENEMLLALTTLLAAALALMIQRRANGGFASAAKPDTSGRSRGSAAGLGVAAGLVALVPWLWAGSLGGLAESVLAFTAAASVGFLAATVLGGSFFAAYAQSRPRQVLLGGLVAGVALTPLGAAVGGTGVSPATLVVLPSLGFAAAALATAVRAARLGRLPLAATFGLAAFGPLGFVDPEETSLLLGTSDVGWWTLVASGLTVAVALAAGAAYGLALNPRRRVPGWLSAAMAVVVAVAGAGVYGLAGRPGLHGDRLFVVLAEQPDLTGLATIADRPERLRATYQRLVEHAERTQAPLRAALDRIGVNYTPYYLVNAIRVDAGPGVRAWLSRRSDVDRVLLDQRLRPLPEPAPPVRGDAPAPDGSPLWNITMVRADAAWRAGATGEGITIGTSDSGVDGTHPALRDGFRGGDDSWYDPWNASAAPVDHNGHGTHTIGSALGRNGIGVAPQAQWIGCVNLDRNLGSPSLYLECLQFMLAPFPRGGDPARHGRPDRAPHVLTNSWSCPEIEGCDPGALRPATAALKAAGIFVVAAAGNTGPRCSTIDDPPAPYPDVLTVGAVDSGKQVTDFSSRGPTDDGSVKPDVVAPGADVLSAMPGGTYASLGGTSMATPHVAGVVALMWSANPRLIGDIDTTTRILRDTTTAASAPGGEYATGACADSANLVGAGLVDAYAAVTAARA